MFIKKMPESKNIIEPLESGLDQVADWEFKEKIVGKVNAIINFINNNFGEESIDDEDENIDNGDQNEGDGKED